MNPPITRPTAEDLHPNLWRASQLAQADGRCVDTGFPALSSLLSGEGWPTGALVDLLVQQHGIGEMRLLAPALAQVADRQIVLLAPPHTPQILGLASLGLTPSHLLWVQTKSSADTLWTAENVLRGGFGALLMWATQVRPESLRRLHLAAQAGETLFFLLRPMYAAQDACAAPLRLTLRPAEGGIEIGFLKRKGPLRDAPLVLPLTTHQPARPRHRQPAPGRAPVVAPQADVPTVEVREQVLQA